MRCWRVKGKSLPSASPGCRTEGILCIFVVQSTTKSCQTLVNCSDPLNCSTPRSPVLHHFPESAQTHVLNWMPSNHLFSAIPFSSWPQSFPASGSFPMNWVFASGGQSIGATASASVLPMNIQGWFPLGFFVLACGFLKLLFSVELTSGVFLIRERLPTPPPSQD